MRGTHWIREKVLAQEEHASGYAPPVPAPPRLDTPPVVEPEADGVAALASVGEGEAASAEESADGSGDAAGEALASPDPSSVGLAAAPVSDAAGSSCLMKTWAEEEYRRDRTARRTSGRGNMALIKALGEKIKSRLSVF